MLDMLHLFRTEGSLEYLPDAVNSIHAVQLCDAPRQMPPENEIISEGRERRRIPGQGELPLRDILEVVLPNVSLSAEVPNLAETSPDYFRRINDESRKILKTLKEREGA